MAVDIQKGQINWVEKCFSPLVAGCGGTEFVAGKTLIRVNDDSTNPSAQGVAGGAVRLPGGGACDIAQMYGPLAFEPDESEHFAMQTTFRVSDVSVISLFVGFTDQIACAEVPISDPAGTLGACAADAFGILMEGDQDVTWNTVSVDSCTLGTQTAVGNISDLSDNDWTTVRIEAKKACCGSFRVLIDGTVVCNACTGPGGWLTSRFSSCVKYAPVISNKRDGANANVDVVEFGWSGPVGNEITNC